MTIDDMVLAYQQGDHANDERLIRIGYGLVDRVITRGGFILPIQYGTIKDLKQEGVIGFVEALSAWRSELGPFKEFAAMCVRRELTSALKAATRKKHKFLNKSLRFENYHRIAKPGAFDDDGESFIGLVDVLDHSGMAVDPQETVLQSEVDNAVFAAMRLVLAEMSPLVRESFTRRVFLAQHYDEIATALNRQYKAIDNAIYRACRDLPAIASRLADDDDLPVDVRGVLAMMARKKVRLVNEERCTKKRKRSVDFWMGDLLSKVV